MESLCVVDDIDSCGEVWLIDCYHNALLISGSSVRRRFFFCAKLSRPLSSFESVESESPSLEPELELDDVVESSDWKGMLWFTFTLAAMLAKMGSFSYISK